MQSVSIGKYFGTLKTYIPIVQSNKKSSITLHPANITA